MLVYLLSLKDTLTCFILVEHLNIPRKQAKPTREAKLMDEIRLTLACVKVVRAQIKSVPVCTWSTQHFGRPIINTYTNMLLCGRNHSEQLCMDYLM